MRQDNKPTSHLEVRSSLNKVIRISKSHWDLITLVKHPITKGKESLVKECLQNPDEVRLSQEDKSVHLYYRSWEQYYLCVVAKHLNGEGYIITIYVTDKIKEGEQIWKK
ncbi:hypothetical protein ES702_03243 [subsurface metagenome]